MSQSLEEFIDPELTVGMVREAAKYALRYPAHQASAFLWEEGLQPYTDPVAAARAVLANRELAQPPFC